MGKIASPWPLLQKRFPPNEYALLAEVRDQAGHSAVRTADGVAMNLWPSRGLELEGIEIKSYRSDWLRELKDPEKAEKLFKYCDRWWLVAAAEHVVEVSEVPNAWGFMVVKGKRLMTIKPAPKLTPTAPLDRSFIAALLKRAVKGMISVDSIDDKIQEARDEAIKDWQKQRDHELDDLRRVRDQYEAFKTASGISIDRHWGGKEIGEAVKFIADGGLPNLLRRVRTVKQHADWLVDQVNEGLSAIEKAAAPIEEGSQS